MAYLRISDAREAGRTVRTGLRKSASEVLTESARGFTSDTRYDIFLSHAYDDAELILGVKELITNLGLTVYVDWIEDPRLDRGNVSSKTAAVLRERMRNCASLVYVHSASSSKSKWMPWELGYFDGFRPGHVWILPLVANADSEFENQEYLGLYPPVEKLASLPQGQNLGFGGVGQYRTDVPLAKASRGSGVWYTS